MSPHEFEAEMIMLTFVTKHPEASQVLLDKMTALAPGNGPVLGMTGVEYLEALLELAKTT